MITAEVKTAVSATAFSLSPKSPWLCGTERGGFMRHIESDDTGTTHRRKVGASTHVQVTEIIRASTGVERWGRFEHVA